GLTFGDDVWVFVAGSRGMEMWQNGTLVGSHGNSVTRIVGSGNWGLGHHAAIGNDLVEYSFLALWGRELSHSEIRLASNNPFGMITPDIDDLGFVAAALASVWVHLVSARGIRAFPHRVRPVIAETGHSRSDDPNLDTERD
ncbi:hypothetical protein LCGC14_2559180, partial [marine sediment metagenome]